MDEVYIIQKSTRKDKKFMVIMGPNMVHHFGQSGYDDYTTHNDDKRKDNCIARMSVKQNWSKKGIHTSGFWAKHVLWAKPTIKGSIKELQQKFGIKIIYKIK